MDEAARAYDAAAILMSGQNAKTNFPISKSSSGDPLVVGGDVSKSSSTDLAAILNAKLRKCCKAPSPSLTCLRLDTENSHIGVWQKHAGTSSDSNWVMTIELGKKNTKSSSESSSSLPDTPMEGQNDNVEGGKMEEEDRIALQMIEELLFKNTPGPSGEASLQV